MCFAGVHILWSLSGGRQISDKMIFMKTIINQIKRYGYLSGVDNKNLKLEQNNLFFSHKHNNLILVKYGFHIKY